MDALSREVAVPIFRLEEWRDRTLKEQAIHGRIFRNLDEVREAVTEFGNRYNRHWRIEKLGFMSPLEARQSYAVRKAT